MTGTGLSGETPTIFVRCEKPPGGAKELQSLGVKGQPKGDFSSEKVVFCHCGHPP